MFESLDLQAEEDLVLVRRRVWRWLRALALDPIATTRLATAASEACRRRLEHGPTALEIELSANGLWLTIDQACWEDLAALLRGALIQGDRLLIRGTVRAPDQRERVSMGQTLQVTEREREQARRASAELADQLARANRELTRNRDALRRVNADLEMIAAAVAHDLRQPLHAVSMFGAVLMASEETAPIGGQVKGAAERMGAMLEGLMQLARIGEAEPASSVTVSSALDQVLADLAPAIDRHSATIERRGDGRVHIGQAHLRVVLQNLVSNAIKYHRDGTPPHIEVRVIPRQDTTRIQVLDNGRGLKRSDLRRVTRLFKRLARDRESEGAGVGLALVKRVVDGYGGELTVRSRPDEPGTVVTVTFSAPD